MLVLRTLGRFLIGFLMFWAAADRILNADEKDAEKGRQRHLGKHHPTSHLPRHAR